MLIGSNRLTNDAQLNLQKLHSRLAHSGFGEQPYYMHNALL